MDRGREVLRGILWVRKRRTSNIKKQSVEVVVYSATHDGRYSGQIEIFDDPIKSTHQKLQKIVLLTEIQPHNGIQGGQPCPYFPKPQSFRSTLKVTSLTATVWPFQIITNSGKAYEFFVDTQEDQTQWLKRLKLLAVFPYSPIPKEPTDNHMKEIFKLQLNAKHYDADSAWAVYILPEEVGSKISIIGMQILTLKWPAKSDTQPGHLSIFSFANPHSPITTWDRDKIRRSGNFGNIVFLELGRRCRGGPGLVWLYVGTEKTETFRQTINTFLNEKQVPLSRLREMTPEPTYSLYDALPPSRKVSADRITRDTPQRLVKSDTGSYSSLDLLAYQSSPISESIMNVGATEISTYHFTYSQEEQQDDKYKKYYEIFVKNKESNLPSPATLNDIGIPDTFENTSKNTDCFASDKQSRRPTKLAIKQDMEKGIGPSLGSTTSTSIDDIMLPATLFLHHQDDHKNCKFCTLISKQIEELFDVSPQNNLLITHVNRSSTSFDNLEHLSGVHIAGKKMFLVQKDTPPIMNWERFGLRITLCEGQLSPSTDTAEISVVALVGGQFKFPRNSKLVSAVYALSVSDSILHLQLRLEMQHCVHLTSEDQLYHLKFAIAPINTTSLPYKFETVEGGQFTVGSWYGSITRSKYSLACIIGTVNSDDEDEEGPPPPTPPPSPSKQEHNPSEAGGVIHPQSEGVGMSEEERTSSQKEVFTFPQSKIKLSTTSQTEMEQRSEISLVPDKNHMSSSPVQPTASAMLEKAMTYAGVLYYKEDGIEDLVTFTAAKYLNALLQFINDKHHSATLGQNIYFRLKYPNGSIELKFDAPQEEPFDGWTIKPHIKPTKMKQSDIDLFGEDYPIPPTCLISVYGAPNAVPSLHYGVPLEGVSEPVTIFIHTKRRTSQETANEPSLSIPSSTEERHHSITAESVDLTKVFKKYYFNLTDNLGRSSVFHRVLDQFFSVGLISDALHSHVTSRSTGDTEYEKGSKIVAELYNRIKTCQNPQNVLSNICDVLINQEDSQLKDVGRNIKRDCRF